MHVQTPAFTLKAYHPAHLASAEVLTIYLEGDGFAWLNGATPSADPTPRDPLALRLALKHPGAAVAYLARPCQFAHEVQPSCEQRYWTDARFAPEVIASTQMAIDQLKQMVGASKLQLVGYSGGANVAALAASERTDVIHLVTVAGNLDHASWTRHHRVKPLVNSLNAADIAHQLDRLPQTHWVGGQDRVIPPSMASSWHKSIKGDQEQYLHIVDGFDHQCCWVEHWHELMPAEPVSASRSKDR
jgi:predicted esterase